MQKANDGFTLIELLVVIIIIGILSAIALPSFLSQVNKARGSEAKVNLSAINRTQEAYYLENQEFANNLDDLKLGIRDTSNYVYHVYTSSKDWTGATANASNPDNRSHLAVVAVKQRKGDFDSVICEADENRLNGFTIANLENVYNQKLHCKENGKRVGK